ncbi:P-loop containing nucleoside triphosphate hydrolase protein [Gymnopilus junonius]|uniref:P-loop containing nucleoside triphosphate hydrolase protein n=1 Tax=Gymnopilus junonius TaxID=109634 RepID=A0A9P5NW98_GYMJU|nr:P-loop containing nucleoside triphosphate hydrolase protein [Gymnopilus junonius]
MLANTPTTAASDTGHTTDGDRRSSPTQTSTAAARTREASSVLTWQSSLKGKSKASEASSSTTRPAKKSSANADNLIGKITNLVTTDLDNMQEGADFLALTFYTPLQIILSMLFLYRILGWSALVGLVTTLAFSPIVGYLGKLVQDVQSIKMKSTDARVQEISEAVGVIRMIKLFGWERKMAGRLESKRNEELRWLWKLKFLKMATELLSVSLPSWSTVATYATYTVIMKEGLTASTIFSSMAVFQILREQLHRMSWQYGLLVDAKVSIDRVSDFMQTTELLDPFIKSQTSSSSVEFHVSDENADDADSEFGFRNATFAWSVVDNDGLLTPSSRDFRLHIDGELLFKRSCINLIIGPTGSGKTSVLMALLGEMHFIPSTADSWFNLPRQGGVAYAAQESWVQNATIRDNILFGSPYDEERYKKVIRQCGLEHDLELFDAGDKTEVGERGLTLSGGQKARVTLARAIYSPADIILLDDVLAALDVHTSAWIVDQCFRGDLVKDRTLLLVTHNVKLVSPVAHFVVSLGLDGSVKTQGYDVSTALESDPLLAAEARQEAVVEAKEVDSTPDKAPDGKLIVAEEIVEGHITWRSMKLFFKGLGGKHYVLFAVLWMLSMFGEEALDTLYTWFLGVWGSQYETHDLSEINLAYYILILSLIMGAHITFWGSVQLYYNYRSIRASRVIHAELIESVFGSTLRWLDETPTARIIARCTQDIRTVDGPIPQSLMWVFNQSAGMLTKLAIIVLFTPVFLFPGIGVAILGILLGKAYLKAQLSIKREMSNARSPLLAHFSAAMHGLVSIRAYGAQNAFSEESLKRIDHYCRAATISFNVNRWIGQRIDILGAAFTSALAFYLVYGGNVGAANTGFSLNMAASFCIYIFWLIRIYNELEVQSNSLERIQGYIDIDHEPKATESGQPPSAWPTSGDLRVENLSARYSEGSTQLVIPYRPGQRVGIVGRTGSGKSSLTLALLRCILTEGTVYYDGIATNTINLDALRSNITIIPQTPELLSGTLRQNLDPFDQNDDATLNDSLRAAGLFSLQEDAGETRLTLDSKIAGGGGNLSVGQRQILALARAMVRGSKLLILDEATSAIDYKTDAVIQRTLRSQLSDDVTVLTVAHRLQTIMDADKIMVLENGRIVEFDSPRILVKKENGIFRGLVDGSGDKELLYEALG